MKDNTKKILGEERRFLLVEWLQSTTSPLKGSELAERANVSRQVIVQDITLLKAKNYPIIATSEGYLYLQTSKNEVTFQKVIVCIHTPEQTKEELHLVVDHGVCVKDVKINHPVYGELSAPVMVSNRMEVDLFLDKISHTNAPFLLQLTDGLHFHTLEADSMIKIEAACLSLNKAGILVQ